MFREFNSSFPPTKESCPGQEQHYGSVSVYDSIFLSNFDIFSFVEPPIAPKPKIVSSCQSNSLFSYFETAIHNLLQNKQL